MEEMQQHKAISIIEILQLMTHDSLFLYKKKRSNAPIEHIRVYNRNQARNPYRKGVVFVSPSKADLTEGVGFVVTSYETLAEKNKQLTHWTPNTYRGGTYYDFGKRKIKGHTKENLKQVNVIGFDIDSKNVDLYGLYLGCEEVGLPRPNLLLETPRGYQFFYILETPFYIHKNEDYKSLRVAERLVQNVRKALSYYAPIDQNCVPFGFYRIPREDNVRDFWLELANTRDLLAWSMQYETKTKPKLHVVYDKNAPQVDYVSSEWYRALLCLEHIERGHFSASRNNTLFTLALANYASGRPFEAAYDELDEFNSRLNAPLAKNEFEKTLESAYSGKYKGVKREYVEGLLQLWTDGKAKFHGKEGWYKFKKERQDRKRSHYDEWEADIINYIEMHQSAEKPFLQGSLSMLANTLGLPLSTLKEVLKRTKTLITKTIGRGRKAYTKLTSRKLFIQHIIRLRQTNQQEKQTALHMFGANDTLLTQENLLGVVYIIEDVPISQLEPLHITENTS